jgi:ribosomal-protein-alanine N-acetyltransferase
LHGEPQLHGAGFVVRVGRTSDIPQIVAYFLRNREHLAPTSPTPPPDFYSAAHWRARLARADEGYRADRLLHCFVFRPRRSSGAASCDEVIGTVSFSNFVRGAFQACHLGYSIDREHEGRGTMSAAVRLMIGHAFGSLNLHRVMANYLPENERSARLLARLGFRIEGHANAYLQIAGAWRDHVLTSLVNENWCEP